MQAADYADKIISDITEQYPYMKGTSVIVMALVKVCGQVLELRGAAEIAQELGVTLRVGETSPAFPSPQREDVAQALAEVADDGNSVPDRRVSPCIRRSTDVGPDYCETCSNILREWVKWESHSVAEATFIKQNKMKRVIPESFDTRAKARFVDHFLYGHLIKCPSCEEPNPLNETTNIYACENCGYEENRA